MRTLLTLFAAAAVLGAGVSYLLTHEPKMESSTANVESSSSSIIRLHNSDTDAFFCSGTVIGPNTILTAAHCVLDQGFFGYSVDKSIKLVKSSDGKMLGYAQAYKLNARGDTAILIASALSAPPRLVETDSKAIISAYEKHKLVLCGYPWGGDLLCVSLTHVKKYIFQFEGYSHAWPGMSGGPVFDLDTGKIVGTVSAGNEQTVIVSPTNELWDMVK